MYGAAHVYIQSESRYNGFRLCLLRRTIQPAPDSAAFPATKNIIHDTHAVYEG